MISVRAAAAIATVLIVAGCAATEEQVAKPPSAATLGQDFAVQHCSSCHAIAAGAISPNPLAPPFAAVVNRSGVTAETLVPWLDNSHFYPDIMSFTIAPGDVANLAAYMLTLQQEDYRPLPR